VASPRGHPRPSARLTLRLETVDIEAGHCSFDEILVSADPLARCEQTVPVAGERTLHLKGIAEALDAVLIAWSDESGVDPSAP
jgi:hypothetical protein